MSTKETELLSKTILNAIARVPAYLLTDEGQKLQLQVFLERQEKKRSRERKRYARKKAVKEKSEETKEETDEDE